MNSEQRTDGYIASNTGYTTESVIKMRLDTEKLLDQLEAFYRGSRVSGYEEREGIIVPRFSDIGRPRMNDQGIQDLMSWLTSLLNPATVQGNKNTMEYGEFMGNLHADIAEALITNIHQYEIDERDYNAIVDKTLAALDMFFSRTIDNLERESYSQTMRSVERVGEKSGFNWLPFGNSKGGMT